MAWRLGFAVGLSDGMALGMSDGMVVGFAVGLSDGMHLVCRMAWRLGSLSG